MSKFWKLLKNADYLSVSRVVRQNWDKILGSLSGVLAGGLLASYLKSDPDKVLDTAAQVGGVTTKQVLDALPAQVTAAPSKTQDQLEKLGYKLAPGSSNTGARASNESTSDEASGNLTSWLNPAKIGWGVATAAALVGIYYGTKNNNIPKLAGDVLSSVLRLIPGLGAMAERVDQWGESSSPTVIDGEIIGSEEEPYLLPVSANNSHGSFTQYERYLKLLKIVFGGDDVAAIQRFIMFRNINVDELASYVKTKNSINVAARTIR